MEQVGDARFYRRTLQVLSHAEVPFLIGGAFALDFHVGTNRRTKDLDLFLRPGDVQAALVALHQAGFRTEVTDPSWLAKAFCGPDFVDLIFAFGNGIAQIDDGWFEHASPGELWGEPVLFSPLEESLLSKAFVMERDRFDGADIAHIVLHAADRLDWDRLLERFGEDWRVLLAHLVLIGYIYPAERTRIPRRVMDGLLCRLGSELDIAGAAGLCYGAFLSRSQYAEDLRRPGMSDARMLRGGSPKPAEV